MTIGKIYGPVDHHKVIRSLVAAKYNSLEIETTPGFKDGVDNKVNEFTEKFPLAQAPAFVSSDGSLTLFESNAIAYFVACSKADTQLLGETANDGTEVLQWAFFADVDLGLPISSWIEPLLGHGLYNKITQNQAVNDVRHALNFLNGHLLHKTFLVGEKVTLSDISVASTLVAPFRHLFDADFRKDYPNVVRYFLTVVNQPQFKEVVGEVQLCQESLKYVAPKKEEKKKQEPKQKAESSKASKANDEEEEEEEKPVKKEKSKLDLLPPSSFILDDWKRFYSNNDTRPDAMEYFWKNFDPQGWSIWRVDYKYNNELTKVFMSANLIGGFFNRLERARKYAFGSVLVLGEDNNNEIHGYFVIRGQEVPEEVTDAADFESYNFTKVDHTDPVQKALIEDYFAWDGDLEGKKCADGKVFK